MSRIITIMAGAGILAIAANANAGIFKIEVPPELEREDVLNPTAEVEAILDAVMREEISKNAAAADFGPVAFTKNGEIIYPDVERTATDDGWSDNRLGFESTLKNYLTN